MVLYTLVFHRKALELWNNGVPKTNGTTSCYRMDIVFSPYFCVWKCVFQCTRALAYMNCLMSLICSTRLLDFWTSRQSLGLGNLRVVHCTAGTEMSGNSGSSFPRFPSGSGRYGFYYMQLYTPGLCAQLPLFLSSHFINQSRIKML